jgi:RNA polymerase sigma-70 factor, ECF subfamily
MASTTEDTDGLIARARGGDPLAEAAILAGHRDRLRRLVASRLDRRVAARIDPSDVIQEALADAALRLSAYLQNPPLPLLPWLRQFALERLAKLHRHHLRTGKRSVDRERPPALSSSHRPKWAPGQHPVAGGTSPSGRAIRDEDCQRVRAAMARLPEADRKLLAMRHIEALSMAQIATALGINEGAAKVRHIRALRRVQTFLEEPR